MHFGSFATPISIKQKLAALHGSSATSNPIIRAGTVEKHGQTVCHASPSISAVRCTPSIGFKADPAKFTCPGIRTT
jgi:hypothetical protein